MMRKQPMALGATSEQLQSAVVAMRQAGVTRAQNEISNLAATKQVIASNTQAAIDYYTKLLNTSFQTPAPPAPPTGDVGQGFRVSGQVTLASDGSAVPGMRLRLADANGVIQMEDPTWISGPDGRYTMNLSPDDAKAQASAIIELADAEGNSLQRLDRTVAAGAAVTANVALADPPAGSALANQIAMARSQLAMLDRAKAQLQAHIDALKARQLIDQQAIDGQIANLQAALNTTGA